MLKTVLYYLSWISIITLGGIVGGIGRVSALEKASNTEEISQEKEEKTGNKVTIKNETDSENTETGSQDKVKKDINASIVEYIVIPKAKQLIKDISTQFTKEYANPAERRQAYENIRKRLLLRKNRIDTLKISEDGRYILKGFLDQTIALLEKEIAELL